MSQNGDAASSAFAKPVPREPKSAAKLAELQRQSRRREYLLSNPSYFDSLDHELADPILYERVIKRFQDAQERESEGKAKGYGRTLEADLVRGETKLAEVDPSRSNGDDGKQASTTARIDQPWDRSATGREDGRELWRAFLEDRFVQGQDEDFDYSAVDTNEDYDGEARKDAENAWFDEEEPSWEGPDGANASPVKQGETGIQDF